MHLFVIANPEQEQLVWPEKNATKKKKNEDIIYVSYRRRFRNRIM